MKKILFVCPYPSGLAPSQRFRFEQYLHHLEEKGFETTIKPFFTEHAHFAFYQSGNLLSKIHALVGSYWNRLSLLLHGRSFDFIFIHREATPAGPPLIEWWLGKILRKKIIYDFDDAIWLTDKQDESQLARFFRWRGKVRAICKWSYRISCGNSYLAAYANPFNTNVFIVPTTIDTENLHAPAPSQISDKETVTIGWTGSCSTLKYLTTLVPTLQLVEKKYPAMRFLIIADEDPKLPLRNAIFRPWRKETEISDLTIIDIGVMPLPDDPWTRGKCGFKALQYMALKIPAVISPIGVNNDIVQHGIEGYLCKTPEDWFTYLEELILDPEKRIAMGERGRQKVIDYYSVRSTSPEFLSLFQ